MHVLVSCAQVVGILKSFLGLSATVYTAVYVALFQPDAVSFIRFLAVCPSLLAVLLTVFINRVPPEYHELEPHPKISISKHARFAAVYAIVTILALVGMVSAIWSAEHHVVGASRRVAITVLMLLLATLLLVPLSSGPCVHPSRRRRALRLAGSASLQREAIRVARASVDGDPRASEVTEPLLCPQGVHQWSPLASTPC